MRKFSLRNLYAWLLAAFFILGGFLNIFASPDVRADYLRWGYPDWFHYLTGTLEWTSAALIAVPFTRLAGSLLAAAVMVGAAVTVLLHGEYSHAVPPMVVLALLCFNIWSTRSAGQK